MRALVTGASGFVGQWLCAALIERGDDVTGTRYDVGADSPSILSAGLSEAIHWHRADLRKRDDIARVLDAAKPDIVFHLAGVTFVPAASADPGEAYEVNVMSAVRLLGEIASRRNAGTLDPVTLVVGSGEQYGRQDTPGPITEDRPQLPLTIYAATKASQEIAALQAWRGSGVRVVCTRSFNHTGRGQAPHFLVPALVRRAMGLRGVASARLPIGNTTPVRDFLHVRDVVRAYLLLADGGRAGEAYNVSSGVGRSVGDLAELVLKRVGVRAELEPSSEFTRPVDLPVLVGDSSKLQAATGWRPTAGIEEAIDELIDAASH
jgi:GDP-4-dehydro-6-deoxy-D-mannose reductase